METTEETKVVPPENGSTETNSSADKTWDSEKYPAWQKSIGKEYWGNEKLKDFASMKDVMEHLVNPPKKAPEKYDLKLEGDYEDVYEAMKKADLSQESATEIAKAFSGHLSKNYTLENLKDGYGADFEEADKNVGKAIEKICAGNKKLTDAIEKRRNDPAVFEVLRIVGQNLGENTTLNLGRKEVHDEKDNSDPFMKLLMNRK